MGDICISARNNAKHKPTAPMETQATTPPGTPQEQQGWYALKIFHNRAVAAEKDLQAIGVECYLPRVEVIVQSSTGRRSVRTRPAIAGLLFVCCPPARLKAIKEAMSGKAMFYPSPDGAPARIPPSEMAIFRLVTSSGESGLEYLSDNQGRYTVGQRVRVLQGPFTGAEGHICRIRGNRRLVVSINGICAVATSYVPACFLQKLPEATKRGNPPDKPETNNGNL